MKKRTYIMLLLVAMIVTSCYIYIREEVFIGIGKGANKVFDSLFIKDREIDSLKLKEKWM